MARTIAPAYMMTNRVAADIYDRFLVAVARLGISQRSGLERALSEWSDRVLAEPPPAPPDQPPEA